MIARGFKPVGWVAAVAASALGCYMLSLNVAAERAELEKVERRIIAARQDIRTLQTELGTRGRLTQLEHWNAEVLALSAPASNQFLDSAVRLASFSQPQPTVEDRTAKVRLASAETVEQQPAARPAVAQDFGAPQLGQQPQPLIRKASLVIDEPSPLEARPSARTAPVKSAPVKAERSKAPLIDADLVAEIGEAARAEKKGGAGGQ